MAVTKPTAADVRAIITTTLLDAQIEAIIDDAALIAEVCLSVMSSDRQKAVLKWLTAHLISQMFSKGPGGGGAVSQRTIGDASETYSVPPLVGSGLMLSAYGQQAILLDPNDCLINLGKIRVKMRTL